MILNFVCKTNSKKNYYEIQRRVHLAGAHVSRDRTLELNGVFEGTISVSSYSGSLYKEIEILNLAELELTILGGTKEN